MLGVCMPKGAYEPHAADRSALIFNYDKAVRDYVHSKFISALPAVYYWFEIS